MLKRVQHCFGYAEEDHTSRHHAQIKSPQTRILRRACRQDKRHLLHMVPIQCSSSGPGFLFSWMGIRLIDAHGLAPLGLIARSKSQASSAQSSKSLIPKKTPRNSFAMDLDSTTRNHHLMALLQLPPVTNPTPPLLLPGPTILRRLQQGHLQTLQGQEL